MFKIKGILAGAILALGLISMPVAQAQTDTADTSKVTEIPAAVPDGVLGYYTTDGGKTFTPIKEEPGVAEKITPGILKTEFMESHRMKPEDEAKIVHRVPSVPFIIDGIRYQPEDIRLFDGRRLGFTMGTDGQLYAFTSFSDLDEFVGEKYDVSPMTSRSDFCVYYEHINCIPTGYVMQVLPSTSLFTLAPMDNMISSMEISSYAANGCTLFDLPNLQGDYFHGYYYIEYPNLGTSGWNDRASSLVVWPR